jgi:hypothetical protein
MYALLREHFRSNSLVRLNTLVLFFVVYVDWMLMPFVAKLEGLYLPVYMISFFMLLSASDGIILPFFKEVSLRAVFYFSALLDLFQIAVYALFWVDPELFTYAILFFFTLQAITFEVARIHTIDWFSEDLEIKPFLMLRSLVISSATIAGTLFTLLFDYFGGNPQWLMLIAAVLGSGGIALQLRLGYRFGRKEALLKLPDHP